VSKQKLDLAPFATVKVAEPRAAAPKMIRREFFVSSTLRGGLDDLLQYFGRYACSLEQIGFVDGSKERAFVDATASFHSSIAAFTHDGTGRYGCAQLCPGGRR
jgi:hypothetical protein